MTERKELPDETLRAALSAIGRKGGKSRTAGLTPKQRKELATKAARARWRRRKKSR